jgi:hypothetical protein
MHKGKFEIEQFYALDGWSSNEILEELMDTSEISLTTKRQFSQMFSLIDAGEYDQAEKISESLEKKSYPHNPDILNARMLIQKGRRNL